MNKKITFVVIILIVLGALIWGFKSIKTPSQTSSNTSQPLRIGLNPWIGHSLYFVAQDKGFFKKEGVTVTLQSFNDGAVGKQLLASNQIDGLSLTPETVVVLKDAGIDVKAIAMTDTSLGADGIVADQNIKTIQDLKDKKVAYEEGSPSHFFLSYLLDQKGMSTKDLQSVNVIAPDAGASFVSGKVDAAVTWEPWLSKVTERPGGHLIATSKELPLLPAMPIIRTEIIQNRKDDLKKMMRALYDARNYIQQNPDESYQIIAKNMGISVQDVKDQLTTFKWFSYEENVAGFSSGIYSAPSLIQKAGDLWFKLGITKTKIDANDVVDTSIIKDLYK